MCIAFHIIVSTKPQSMDCVVGKKHPNLRLDTIFKHSFIKVSGVKAQVASRHSQSPISTEEGAFYKYLCPLENTSFPRSSPTLMSDVWVWPKQDLKCFYVREWEKGLVKNCWKYLNSAITGGWGWTLHHLFIPENNKSKFVGVMPSYRKDFYF